MWFAVGSRILSISRSFCAAERRKGASRYNFIEMRMEGTSAIALNEAAATSPSASLRYMVVLLHDAHSARVDAFQSYPSTVRCIVQEQGSKMLSAIF